MDLSFWEMTEIYIEMFKWDKKCVDTTCLHSCKIKILIRSTHI
jgi:hypothetical protein